ncbi:MAG TPA: Re/Si-specific NAD(P)(+) transhydrogenase subunit alpha [Candidatus Baltobacteraceae bacterium]|jgi:NAD(P) transhydrogenase subunit alpha|nr:Re/Si-specific NAD(P)(+) transhydrogenase subunit alpha [Candidatus Baltobacteraceae bacterium]
MLIGVPTESALGEHRVALVPETTARLIKAGTPVCIQRGAGLAASFPDAEYEKAGATFADTAGELLARADLVIKVQRPSDAELGQIRAGSVLLAFLSPLGDPQSVRRYADHQITALSMDAIPRITRAQTMDALSSQANVAGYKAVLLAACELPRYFPMLTTAAGTIPPAKVLVLGAGVAGLQALATARRLGAVVSGYDTRAVVKEQVKSLGANFLELDLGVDAQGAGGYAVALTAEQEQRQLSLLAQHAASFDVIVTTAAVPGRRAPLLLNETAVSGMKPGSVIVDLAAETGGNCALTKVGETITTHGVTIIGTTNIPSTMPYHSSQLYSRNVFNLLQLLLKNGEINLDFTDEITKGTTLTHHGSVLHEPTIAALAAQGVTAR